MQKAVQTFASSAKSSLKGLTRAFSTLPAHGNNVGATLSAQALRNIEETAAPARQTSMIQEFFGVSPYPRVPLSSAFPSAPELQEPVKASDKIEVSTLSNGVRVASWETSSPISAVAVMVDSGSRDETPEIEGIHKFFETLAFKSTENRSEYRLARDLAKMGANASFGSGREHMMWYADGMRHQVPHLLATLADVIQFHAFKPHEVETAIASYEATLQHRGSDPKFIDAQVLEAALNQAFAGSSVGRTGYGNNHSISTFNPELLKRFVSQTFTPSKVTVVGCGVDHQQLTSLSQELFQYLYPDVAASNETKTSLNTQPIQLARTPAKYVGGESRIALSGSYHHANLGGVPTAADFVHVVLGLEAPRLADADYTAFSVLINLLGYGSSFSAGGPGKGMHTRLVTEVLNRYNVDVIGAHGESFTDSGAFFLLGRADFKMGGQLTNLICEQAAKMNQVTDAEVQRAKRLCISNFLSNLSEVRAIRAEDMGRQLQAFNKIHTPAEFVAQIEQVTAADVKRVAERLLASNPTFVVYNDQYNTVPQFDYVKRLLKK